MKDHFTVGVQSLSGVEAFLSVAQHRNFRRAAEDLGMSPSAVSQQIRSLEERLGVSLLMRTTRSVGLTQAGQIFLARARPALEGLRGAYEETRNLAEPAGLLRLHIPKGALPMLVEPVLREFCPAYPRIELEILTSDSVPDLIAEGFDAGVQLREALDADSVALRLTPPIDFVVVGAPSYFAEHGRPSTPGDLRGHQCIRHRIDGDRNIGWTFFENNRSLHVPVTGRIISDDYAFCIAAAVSGLGLFLVARNIVEDALREGELEIVLDRSPIRSEGLFLHYPNRAQVLPKLRVFIDYLQGLRIN